jgi:hypothetical protein
MIQGAVTLSLNHFKDIERLVLAGWNFESLRARILAGFVDKGL